MITSTNKYKGFQVHTSTIDCKYNLSVNNYKYRQVLKITSTDRYKWLQITVITCL